MVPFSLCGIAGDQYYLAALKTLNLQDFKTAKQFFPFDLSILQGEAEFYIKNQIVNKKAYQTINEAIFYDPYSVRFLSLKVQYALALNDTFIGYVTFANLKHSFPNTRTVKQLSEVIK